MIRMVKGERTELTYKVKLYEYFGSWRSVVYEPYMGKYLGLFGKTVRYREVFRPDDAVDFFKDNLHPEDVRRLTEKAVRSYEDYKLAWEAA